MSTAIHEFFGIAIAEAAYCGALPILPLRLSYPELVPVALRARCLYRGRDGLVRQLRWALEHAAEAAELAAELPRALTRFGWRAVAPRYDAILATVAMR